MHGLFDQQLRICNGDGAMARMDGEVSHDKITRFLSEREYTSKDLWREVKSVVRQIERAEGVLIFDDTISAALVGVLPSRENRSYYLPCRQHGSNISRRR